MLNTAIKTIRKAINKREVKTSDILGYHAGYINSPAYNKTELTWILTDKDNARALEQIENAMKSIIAYAEAYKSSELTHWNVEGFDRDSLNQESKLQELKNRVFEVAAYRGEQKVYLGYSSNGEILEKQNARDSHGIVLTKDTANFTHIKTFKQ
ncbi:TPA: hypothetical protein NJ185_003595 [Vibrio parahaemolyticus]|uniref:hypothetical protein n=1 Tax=Vibrio parahaemolyticus TaxID=670 RepID=UPI00076170F3|nr:hypothetical protein [Vibrio parahaemolyticus]KWU35327.1 hypothetical protein AVL51_00455 [Vibrio parahaemolyticus]HCG6518870.1 hypothetical protein [Vibrio parahaemolyticus]HCG7714679.1 hypothetical protein [Vibrio parahaemolyticus]HCM0682452.1 hypothetical protein [Vibrio parahaemolyticus]HCM1019910.1 hypothetical protein [Vibrio parahaemolyticus]